MTNTNYDVDRRKAIADAIASLGYDGIVAFDRTEPEYDVFQTFLSRGHDKNSVFLLAVCSGVLDYQFPSKMDAHDYWDTLEQTVDEYGMLQSHSDIRRVLEIVLDEPISKKKNSEKKYRLNKIFDRGFAEWFVSTHAQVPSDEVWYELADVLDTDPNQKTVAFPMKVYDIANLISEGEYLKFNQSVPIPVDIHVRNVSHKSGLVPDLPNPTRSDETKLQPFNQDVREAWNEVVRQVDTLVDRNVSVLRVDSIVWQLGQQIYYANANCPTQKITEYMVETVGTPRDVASTLSGELLKTASGDTSVPQGVTPVSAIDTDGEWIDEMLVEVLTLWDNDHDSIDQTGLICDKTGKCKFTKWSKANLPEMEEGEVYRLQRVVTDEYEGSYSILLNSASSILKVDMDLDAS